MTTDAAVRARWARWWIAMWLVIGVGLVVTAIVMPFNVWSVLVLFAFGVPESVGLWTKGDKYPPLTQVIRRYAASGIAFAGIYGTFGVIAAYWFGGPTPLRMGAMFAVLGWLTNHFANAYGGEGE